MITSNSFILFLRKFFNGTIILSLLFSTSFVNVNSKIFFLEADYYQDKTQEKKITVGKGEIISSDNAFKRVAISGPNIADIQVLNEKQIFLRAKNLGITTFLAWEKDVELPTRYDILVLPDIKSLSAQLQELDENI
ncbi:MAG: pilus assembly protein N-terminal domain-containing protein, partial [Candidatus Melainabacteria bacterium]|nr:pilus assembly protein N-terminal domain-containing protein [Candidatus Melainabacteria bacterium]